MKSSVLAEKTYRFARCWHFSDKKRICLSTHSKCAFELIPDLFQKKKLQDEFIEYWNDSLAKKIIL